MGFPHPHGHEGHWLAHGPIYHLEKAEKHPHTEAHGPKPVNPQAGGVTKTSFHNVMRHWGSVTPGKETDLKFYPHDAVTHPDHEERIDHHIKSTGHKVYYAGGKHGKPDLKNKNYNTKHLMIYDPSAGSGGDFGHESYTRTWRKAHEKAHADTYSHVNQKYGEGRRMGKLGTHRSPREMKRAVEWEWHTAHRQREIHAEAGLHISDKQFHKEVNTVMGDAVHRSLTGKFTEPHQQGFEPHDHKVPLHHALKMIDDHAKKIGLRHADDTLKKQSNEARAAKRAARMKKSEVIEMLLEQLKKGELKDASIITKIELGDETFLKNYLEELEKAKKKMKKQGSVPPAINPASGGVDSTGGV